MTTLSVARISYDAAARAVALAMAAGARRDVRVVVAVADVSMTIVAYGMADGATAHSAETSTRKAKTSASTGKPSDALPEELATALALGTGGILTPIAGGLPIRFDGVHVGGLGVAGGPPATDREVALEVLALLGADRIETAA